MDMDWELVGQHQRTDQGQRQQHRGITQPERMSHSPSPTGRQNTQCGQRNSSGDHLLLS
jgi:hypothetical protein